MVSIKLCERKLEHPQILIIGGGVKGKGINELYATPMICLLNPILLMELSYKQF
jgi:hypothetical protein